MPKIQVPEKLKPFLATSKRFKIAFGGRGGAKSNTFADIFLFKSQTEQAKIGCFREMQNSIEDSVHSLLKAEIARLELKGFTTEKATIYNNQGGEFRFKGLARNPDAVKSMHGFKYFWVEEGQSISQDSLDMLTPTLRETDSELWVSMNLGSSEDPMAKRFIIPYWSQLLKDGYYEDDLHLIVWINYTDNPWFPDSLEQERKWDFENKDRAEYNHIWLGYPNDQVDNSIIKPEWFDATIDAHLKLGFKPRGIRTVAHDPSDTGDPKGLCFRHGSVILEAMESTIPDVNEGLDWALDFTLKKNPDRFIWDVGGLGLSLKRQVADSLSGTKIDYLPFNGAEGPQRPEDYYQDTDKDAHDKKRKNKDYFKNLRAHCYGLLRDRIYNTYLAVEKGKYIDPDEMLSISSEVKHLNKLRAELCRIPKKSNGSGLFQLMDKSEMKSRYKIDSPNIGDSVMMTELFHETKKNELKPLKANTRYVV